MMLILQQCTAVDFSGMSNNFSLILTKKRIKMITRNEKAKGLWWRLLATLPVLAILMIANTKVKAQEKKAVDKPITIEMGQFEIYDDDGAPIQLNDTIIYGEDGSSIKFQASDSFDPITGEPCKKLTVTSYNADGTENSFFITETEKRGDTARYSIEPFSISGSLFETLLDVATSKEDTVYQIVEQMPQYTGGEEAMMKYVAENIKYPQAAKDKNISGRVFVGFVIEKDGSVSNVKVVRGIGGGCDEEAARVIKEMPKWKPGMQKGKPVRVNYMMPIFFKLDDGQPAKSVKKEKASNPDMTPDKNGVYQIVEEMPQYPGGEDALMDYVSKNVVYPSEAQEKGISGRVFVGFIVEKDGSVSNVKVLRGIGGGCDEEAVRVISGLPKWKPGKQDGKPVRVSYQMPINFKLQ
jgi:TonB family protein